MRHIKKICAEIFLLLLYRFGKYIDGGDHIFDL